MARRIKYAATGNNPASGLWRTIDPDTGKPKDTSCPLSALQRRNADGSFAPFTPEQEDALTRWFECGTRHHDGRRKDAVVIVSPDVKPDDGYPKASEAIKQYLNAITAAGAAKKTVQARKSLTCWMLKWCGEDLTDWKKDFFSHMERKHKHLCRYQRPQCFDPHCDGHRYLPNPVNNFSTTMSDMRNVLAERGVVIPVIGKRVGKRKKLKSAPRSTEVEIVTKPAPLRALLNLGHEIPYMRVVQALCALSPLNPVDISKLDWSEVGGGIFKKDHGRVWIEAERQKVAGDGGPINYPLPPVLETMLRERWELSGRLKTGRVLHEMPKTDHCVRKHLKPSMLACGIPVQDRVAVFKVFRHSFATIIEEEIGASETVVDYLMGHSNPPGVEREWKEDGPKLHQGAEEQGRFGDG